MKKKRKNNKLHRAITHIKLDFANIGKLNQLDDLAESFMFLVQAYVDHIFDNNLKEASKFDEIPKIETNLSERYKRCAWQQAVGIMQSFFSNERVNKPILKRIIIQGNANVIKIEKSRTEEFDFWLKISTLEKGRPIRIPIKMHRYGNKIIKTGKLCSGVGLNFENGQWYATFVVETKNQKEKSQGSIVGVDLGIKNLLTTQTGHFGQFSQKLTDLVQKNDEKRRRKQKLNACLKKKGREPVSLQNKKLEATIKNEIGRAINLFIRSLPMNPTVVMERLSIRGMKFKSKSMNRVLKTSKIGYAIVRLKEKLGLVITSAMRLNLPVSLFFSALQAKAFFQQAIRIY